MKIKIELLSDLCTASGEAHNSLIDSDVTYDEWGIPYIPAKRLKGCIREAALELVELVNDRYYISSDMTQESTQVSTPK